MHVCMMFSTNFPPNEGIGNYVYNASRKLAEKGHQVTLITRGSTRKVQREFINEIEVFKAPFLPVYPFHVSMHGIFVNRLIRFLRSKLTIVHLHHPFPPAIKTTLPKIITVHLPIKTDARYTCGMDFYSTVRKIQAKIDYWQELKLLKSSDMITAVSQSVARDLCKDFKLNRDEIIVIGNGVDEKTFKPLQHKCKDRYILYTGCSSYTAKTGKYYRKGLHDLVECAKFIYKEDPGISFVLTGGGPFLGKLQKKIKDVGLERSFIFTGYVSKNKLIQLYQNATVYVMSSYYEGLPTSLLEAMSCGLPVIATAVSGNVDLISYGVNGLLVPPKSPKEMAKAVSMLLDDTNLRKKLGETARRTVEEHYTWDRVVERILECYESLI